TLGGWLVVTAAPARVRSLGARGAPELARRLRVPPMKDAIEGARRLVADGARDLGDAQLALPQEGAGLVHAPAREVLERRLAHLRLEALRERRARHPCRAGQRLDRPGVRGRLVHRAERR